MFRKQQKSASESTKIKSFSSRVGKRGAKKEEDNRLIDEVKKSKDEKKEEKTPVLKAATTIGIEQVASVGPDSSNANTLLITLKPLVGDYEFRYDPNYTITGNTFKALLIPIPEDIGVDNYTKARIFIPSYNPTTSDANLLPMVEDEQTHTTIRAPFQYIIPIYNNNSNGTFPKAENPITIEKLYLTNLAENYIVDNLPSADDIFVAASDDNPAKIIGIQALASYTSCTDDHSDVQELHTTNWLYAKADNVFNNVAVKGEIPAWIYDNLGLPLKLGDVDNGAYPIIAANSNQAATYEIHSFNNLPTPKMPLVTYNTTSNQLVNISSINLSTTPMRSNEPINIVDKFKNFYVNNVTVAPDTSRDIVSQFTQTVGTEYMGSNVTIKSAGSEVELPIKNDLINLISSIEYTAPSSADQPCTILINIKANEGNIFANNRKSETEKEDIIIDLTSKSDLNDVLKNVDLGNTKIELKQRYVVLHGEWDNTNGPKLTLNGDENINSVTIKYIKSTTNDGTTTNEEKIVKLVKEPVENSDEKKLISIKNEIVELYLIKGTLNGRLLASLQNTQENPIFVEGNNSEYYIKGIKELVIDVEPEDDQVELDTSFKLFGDNVLTSNIISIELTNMFNYNHSLTKNNLVIGGNIPEWFLKGWAQYIRVVTENTEYGWRYKKIENETEYCNLDNFNKIPFNKSNDNNLPIGIDNSSFSPFNAIIGSTTNYIDISQEPYNNNMETKFSNFHIQEIFIDKTTSTESKIKLISPKDYDYVGTIIHVKSEGGSAVELPVDDPLVPLIKNITFENGALTFTIKPNNVTNLLAANQLKEGDTTTPGHIIIDLTTSQWNDVLNVLPTTSVSRILFSQEAVILNGDWSTDGNPDVRLNGEDVLEQIDIKYIKSTTENEVTTNSVETLELKMVDVIVDSSIIDLYLVNGAVTDSLLTSISQDKPVFVEDENKNHSIQNIPELVYEDDDGITNQIKLLHRYTTDKIGEENQHEELSHDTTIVNVHTTNMISKKEGSTANLVVRGTLPYWVLDEFSTNGYNVQQSETTTSTWDIIPQNVTNSKIKNAKNQKKGKKNLQTSSLFIGEFNALPVTGFGPELDIGIFNVDSVLKESQPYELTKDIIKSNFHIYSIDVEKKSGSQYAIQLSAPNEMQYQGTQVVIYDNGNDPEPGPEPSGDLEHLKISTLDELYNLMMEPRIWDNEGILKATRKNDITTQIIADGYKLYYNPVVTKGEERMKFIKTESEEPPADPWVEVKVMAEAIEDITDEPTPCKVRIYLAYTNTNNVDHIIPYGVIGNGAFEGSELDPRFEVNGNKYNLKIEAIMDSINDRQIEEVQDKLELTNKAKTEEAAKIKKSEMYEYICEMKRVFSAMPYNMRYINEVLGYLSKCLAFEEIRLPSIRESDNQGLESVNEEYDAETNPNGWIEKYTEEFTKNGVIYRVVDNYENYKFRDGGKHDDLIDSLRTKLSDIYMYYALGKEEGSESLGLDYIMNVLIGEYMDIWMKYYKGLVIPNNLIIREYSDIEIYEDEHIYKVFEGDGEEGTHIISKLTDGKTEDTDGEELKKFIEELMMYFKDEINSVTGNKGEIKSVSIDDMVAYEDPLKELTNEDVDTDSAAIDEALSNNENNLIEYSQMLSTIQGERNKLQRQGNKNKFILKFTQTVKGTFFEMLGKERVNTDQKSQIFGFFISELQRLVNHIVEPKVDRRSKRGIKHEVKAIPDEIEGKWYLRITKIPEFYKGDPLDWINDTYYTNKVFLQNCDNLYVGIDPELDQRITPVGTPVEGSSTELKEKEMIGYYILKVNY